MTAIGINDLKDRPTHMLSYGQKKRVTIADILAMEPKVIICDEPTAWLDPKHAKQTVQLFNEISQNGTTVILSTHDVDLAFSWADYVFIMSDGGVIGEGTPDKIFTDNDLIQEGCLSEKTPLPRNRGELFELMYRCGGE